MIPFFHLRTEERYGFDWDALMQDIRERRKLWNSLTPGIPSMEVVPRLAEGALKKISEAKTREHLQQ